MSEVGRKLRVQGPRFMHGFAEKKIPAPKARNDLGFRFRFWQEGWRSQEYKDEHIGKSQRPEKKSKGSEKQ